MKGLEPRRVDTSAIAAAPFLVVCCARDESPRLTRFLAHYRALGAGHFLVVDNGSTDGFAERVLAQGDCSLWHAAGSYRDARFGMDWCHALLDRFGAGKWCLTVDLDEFLLYPHCEERGLRHLTRHMEKVGQQALFAVLVDAYGPGRVSESVLGDGDDPFEVCPWFDRFNFTQRVGKEKDHLWVQGGVRMRRLFADAALQAPAVNKMPLVRWRRGLRYASSTHFLRDAAMNLALASKPEGVSGVLFHFKFVRQLIERAEDEIRRVEHYAGALEYRRYVELGDRVLFDPEISRRYDGTAQLERDGFMQRGTWF